MSDLDVNEKELLNSFAKDEWESVPDFSKRKEDLKDYAWAPVRKDKRVNIRISERDLKELQRIALKEGLPYQTLISSVLHKYVNRVPVGQI